MVFSRQTGLNSAAWLRKNSAVIFSTTIKYNMAARLQEYSATVLPYSSTIYPHTTCMQTTYKYQKYFSPEHKQHWHQQKKQSIRKVSSEALEKTLPCVSKQFIKTW